MITKIQYIDEIERQHIINENIERILFEEQNITEGNFLLFADTVDDIPTFKSHIVYTQVPQDEYEQLKQTQSLMQTALDELILGGAL